MTDDMLELADVIRAQDLQTEVVAPGVHMPTVDAAAAAVGVAPEKIFKSMDIIRLTGAAVHDVILDGRGGS